MIAILVRSTPVVAAETGWVPGQSFGTVYEAATDAITRAAVMRRDRVHGPSGRQLCSAGIHLPESNAMYRRPSADCCD